MDKKMFALNAIAPYLKDPTICGFDHENNVCKYVTSSGNKCVAGQFMRETYINDTESIDDILETVSQSQVFVPEVVNILTSKEWSYLQRMHDMIATFNTNSNSSLLQLENLCTECGLFTFKELQDAAG